MVKRLLLLAAVVMCANFATGQTLEELKATKATKDAELAAAKATFDALTGEVDGLATQIANLSGWQLGALGTLGANFSQFDNWLGAANPHATTTQFGATGNAFANLQTEGYFWRNNLNLVATRTKLVIAKEDRDDAEFETTADAVNLTSLFGYKLSSKWAVSALGEYRSTVLTNFNNPGYLDLGAGLTWTPIPNAVVVFHPLNYNFVFADDALSYESSLGCKIMADYSRELPMGIAWKTNLSAFVSYDGADLSNWTWTNGLSFTAWKGIGVGIDFGLRGNTQESYNTFLNLPENVNAGITKDNFTIDQLGNSDNPLQSYYVIGLSYKI